MHILLPNEPFEIIAVIRELCVLELDIHNSPAAIMLTVWVNESQALSQHRISQIVAARGIPKRRPACCGV
jgi:hypothetical protein